MTFAELVTAARRLLSDTDTAYRRHEDDAYYEAITLALQAAYRLRPDLFVGRRDTLRTYTVADADAEPPLDRAYHGPLVYYVAAHLDLLEDPHANNQRALQLRQLFEAEMRR